MYMYLFCGRIPAVYRYNLASKHFYKYISFNVTAT